MTLTRRALLRGTAAAAGLGLAGLTTTGCSGLAPGRDTSGSLDYWNLFGGGDGVRMTEMLAGFRAAHPGISLSAVTLAWGNPYYTKLSLATLGGKPPDVAVAHLTRMKTMVGAGLLTELRPADLARHGIAADKFTARAWQAGLVDGRTYAIPIDTHPFVMFYNTDICAKAGLLDPAGALLPLDTPEKFVDAMRRAKEASGAYGGVVSINNDTATPWRIYQSLYGQLGGEMLADEGRRVVIDGAAATRVLTFLQSLTRDGLFPADIDYQGSIALFANGQAGFYFQGEWEISTYQTAKMPFSMTLFPNLYGGDRYAVQADSHTLVIPRQPHRDEEQIDRSLLLIRSMLDQSRTWAAGGHVPTWLPFRDSGEYQAMTPQSNYAAAADGTIYDPDGWYSGSGSNFEIVTGSAIGAVLGGQQSPADAIAQMRRQLDTLSKTASPV